MIDLEEKMQMRFQILKQFYKKTGFWFLGIGLMATFVLVAGLVLQIYALVSQAPEPAPVQKTIFVPESAQIKLEPFDEVYQTKIQLDEWKVLHEAHLYSGHPVVYVFVDWRDGDHNVKVTYVLDRKKNGFIVASNDMINPFGDVEGFWEPMVRHVVKDTLVVEPARIRMRLAWVVTFVCFASVMTLYWLCILDLWKSSRTEIQKLALARST